MRPGKCRHAGSTDDPTEVLHHCTGVLVNAAYLVLSCWDSSCRRLASREVRRRRDMLSTPSACSLLKLNCCCSASEAAAPARRSQVDISIWQSCVTSRRGNVHGSWLHTFSHDLHRRMTEGQQAGEIERLHIDRTGLCMYLRSSHRVGRGKCAHQQHLQGLLLNDADQRSAQRMVSLHSVLAAHMHTHIPTTGAN